MTQVDLGGGSQSLTQKLLRRKPVTVMSAETGADSEGGELKRSIGLFAHWEFLTDGSGGRRIG